MKPRNRSAAPAPEDYKKGQNIPNGETAEAIENARNGVDLSRGFSTVKDLMEDLET